MTRIEKLQQGGILRLGRTNSFRYVGADGSRISRADLARIEALKIPPAWTNVAINRAATGILQAVGKDAAGRWQYVYHERQVKNRERKKFHRLLTFAAAVPKMRGLISRDLRKRDLGRECVMACILRILATCFLRPGSQVYANENGAKERGGPSAGSASEKAEPSFANDKDYKGVWLDAALRSRRGRRSRRLDILGRDRKSVV